MTDELNGQCCGRCAHFKSAKDQRMNRMGFQQCDQQEPQHYRPAHLGCAFEPSRFTPKQYVEV